MEPDDLKCPICLEMLKDPVMLPICGHTFCRSCLTNLTSQPPLCPICRKQHQGLPVHQLPTNYTVSSLIRQHNLSVAAASADLVKAVMGEDAVAVRAALGKGASPNSLCTWVAGDGQTYKDEPVLGFACVQESTAIVKALLGHPSILVDQCAPGGNTPLLEAVLQDNLAICRLLLEGGADPALPSGPGSLPPIVAAAIHGRLEVVKLLLSHKVDPDSVSASGSTALYKAAFKGHRAVAEALLSGGADPQLLHPKYKDTAADMAEEKGFKDLALWLRKQRKQ